MRNFGLFLAVALAAALPAAALELSLCVDPRSGFDRMTADVFEQELTRIVAESGKTLRTLPCRQAGAPAPPAAGAAAILPLRLKVEDRPHAAHPGDALGSARRNGAGEILPEFAVYVAPVARLVGTRLPGVLGRSLARVAAHELGHYLGQRERHDREGLMSEFFTGPQLLAAKPAHFRLR